MQSTDRSIYLIDPFHVHRKPESRKDGRRFFVRLTFSPIEIRDDSNTINPMIKLGPYNRSDVRDYLRDVPEGFRNLP